MKKTNEKGFIIPLLLIAVGAYLGWMAFAHMQPQDPTPAAVTTPSTATGVRGSTGADYTPTSATASTDLSTWKTVSAPGGLANFKFPGDWSLKGTTLTSPKSDIVINATYGRGSLPACDPTNCTSGSRGGINYTRTLTTSGSVLTITYKASKLGFLGTAVATLPNDPKQTANIALVDEIVGTVKVK
jgi:hypothetical protein